MLLIAIKTRFYEMIIQVSEAFCGGARNVRGFRLSTLVMGKVVTTLKHLETRHLQPVLTETLLRFLPEPCSFDPEACLNKNFPTLLVFLPASWIPRNRNFRTTQQRKIISQLQPSDFW